MSSCLMYVSCIILKTTSTIVMWLNFDHGRNSYMSDNSVICVKICHFMWVSNFYLYKWYLIHVWGRWLSNGMHSYICKIYIFCVIWLSVVFLHVGSYTRGYQSRRGCLLSEYGRYISLLTLSHFSVENCCKCLCHL